jgi:hypothetical protein
MWMGFDGLHRGAVALAISSKGASNAAHSPAQRRHPRLDYFFFAFAAAGLASLGST